MPPRILILLFAAVAAAAQTRVDPDRVERLLGRAVVLDLHCDTTQMILDEGYNLAELHNYGQVDIPRLRRGHVSGIFLSIFTPASRPPLEAMRRALEEIDAVRRETKRHPADLQLAATADEVLAAKKRGRIAILMGVEGGHMIDSNPAILRTYFQLGARYMTLTHSGHTPWADSSGQPAVHNGLTDLGKELVREMNRLGMMVDISHVADKTFWDVMEISTAAVIASHSSCRALAKNARNMTDEMIQAVAKRGGVVHINYAEGFLDDDFAARSRALRAERTRQGAGGERQPRTPEQHRANLERVAKMGRIPLSRLLDHFEHAVKVAGVDHVGMGSDFDGVGDQLPEGMEDISKTPNLVRGLMERGFSDTDIEKILGGNTLRVMREVERAAQK